MSSPNCEIKDKKLDLPPKNNLIPKNFDILPKSENYSQVPQLLKQWPDADLWYKKDDKFNRPKAVIGMKLYTSDCQYGFNIDSKLFIYVWQQLASEYLREFTYMAECASLSFQIHVMNNNLNFCWSGFNDSMPNYIKEIMEKLPDMKKENLSTFFD